MTSTFLNDYRKTFTVLEKFGNTVTGAQSNQSVLAVSQKHLMDDTEVTDEDAEWVVIEYLVEMTGAGTFVFTDGSSAKGSPVTLVANAPTRFYGPIHIGLGKALCVTTTGAFNTKFDVWVAQRCYRLSKPAKVIGS